MTRLDYAAASAGAGNRRPGPSERGRWLAAEALARQDAMTRATQLVAIGGRTNDASLHARQYLERALGAGSRTVFTAADYRYAAIAVHDAGRGVHGDVLEVIAAADAELQAVIPVWASRYAARPVTRDERAADAHIRSGTLVLSGQPGRGIDGAGYTRAYWKRAPDRPAVVITSSAATRTIVNFANIHDARAWLESRAPGMTGALRTAVYGPSNRTSREEEVIAFLLRSPHEAGAVTPVLRPEMMTTHLRAELLAAWQWLGRDGGAPPLGAVMAVYQRRLLRAPGWAADDIGWPGASGAMAYLHRLAATPVTAAQASAAVQVLVQADAAPHGERGPLPRAAPPRQLPAAAPLLQPPPGITPAPGGPVPRW